MTDIHNKQFIFKFKVEGKTTLSDWGKIGTVFVFIALGAVSIPFVFLTYRAITEDSRFFIFSALFALLILLFGPYQLWIKKYYFFGLTQDGLLIMKSVINFIPRSFEINVQNISCIKKQDIRVSPAALFYDKNNILIAKFNPMIMNRKRFFGFLSELKKLNPDIKY